jgi:hypothetical protein
MSAKPRFTVTVPSRYKQKDFMDLILKWKAESLLHVSGDALSMTVRNKSVLFERLGKKFELSVFSMGGNVDIDIVEV